MDAKLYEAFNDVEAKHWWFVARRAYLKAFLSKFMPLDGSLALAEIGAGTGGNFNMLSKFGKLDAVEMDESALKLAKSKLMVDNTDRTTTIQHGWLPDNVPLQGQYDCVLALDVIEHVKEDGAAIKTLVNLVKPSGFLLITVPAYQWLWSAHDEVNHHYRRYTAKRLKALFKISEVRILKLGYFNTLLFPIAVIRRLSQQLAKNSKNAHADLDLPSRLTNKILNFIFSLESKWAGVLSMPFGLSVIIIVQKNEN